MFCPTYFLHKYKKHLDRILHIQISLGSKFQLQQTIFIFLEQIYPQKNPSGQKQQKMNITIESFMSELV